MFKIIAVLSLALLAVNAYDFSDTYFSKWKRMNSYENKNGKLVFQKKQKKRRILKKEKY